MQGLIPASGRSLEGGNGNPLQYSCLENPLDRGAWRAIVHRVTKSRTWLKWLITHANLQKWKPSLSYPLSHSLCPPLPQQCLTHGMCPPLCRSGWDTWEAPPMITDHMGGCSGILHGPHHGECPRTQRSLASVPQNKQQGLWRHFYWLWWLKQKTERKEVCPGLFPPKFPPKIVPCIICSVHQKREVWK